MLLDILLESATKKKAKVKIVIKHPGILEVPEGKLFWQLPISHYFTLVEKNGLAPIVRALANIETFNKRKDPDLRDKAHKIIEKLEKKYGKENVKRGR
ncbi:MAG: hypothetical protein QXP36_02050 [Conexivisphaerales archaeon]